MPLLPPMMRMRAPESLDVYFLASDIVDESSKCPWCVKLGFAFDVEEITRLYMI